MLRVVPSAFIVGGAYTAPGYRFRSALMLAAILVVGVLVGVVMVYSGDYNVEFKDSPALIGFKGALVLAGLSFGIFRAWGAEHPA
jgi:hypothetical protein